MFKVFLMLLCINAGGNFEMDKDHFLYKGRILDQESGTPIEGAHLLSSNQQAITDRDGYFAIILKESDRIYISHISYQSQELIVREDAMPIVLYMRPLEQELEEVIVTSMPSESELKQQLLNTPYISTFMEENLQQNVSNMKTIYRLNNNHTWNGIDHAIQKMSGGNGEVTLFSLNPSLGILGVIRSFRKPGAIPFQKPKNDIHPSTFRFIGDTTIRYKKYFD